MGKVSFLGAVLSAGGAGFEGPGWPHGSWGCSWGCSWARSQRWLGAARLSCAQPSGGRCGLAPLLAAAWLR